MDGWLASWMDVSMEAERHNPHTLCYEVCGPFDRGRGNVGREGRKAKACLCYRRHRDRLTRAQEERFPQESLRLHKKLPLLVLGPWFIRPTSQVHAYHLPLYLG